MGSLTHEFLPSSEKLIILSDEYNIDKMSYLHQLVIIINSYPIIIMKT